MYDQIAKLLWKGAVAVVVAVAACYADKKVKEATGKHIHQHAADFVKKMWARLKNWAENYLAEHPDVQKIYLSAASIAASIKRATNNAEDFIAVKLFGKEYNRYECRVIKEENVTLEQADYVLQQANEDPTLALKT